MYKQELVGTGDGCGRNLVFLGEQCTSVKLQCMVHGAKMTFCECCQMLLEITYTDLSCPSLNTNPF